MNKQTDGYQFKIEGDARTLYDFVKALEHVTNATRHLSPRQTGQAHGNPDFGYGMDIKRIPQDELRLRKPEESSDIPLEVAEAVIDRTV